MKIRLLENLENCKRILAIEKEIKDYNNNNNNNDNNNNDHNNLLNGLFRNLIFEIQLFSNFILILKKKCYFYFLAKLTISFNK